MASLSLSKRALRKRADGILASLSQGEVERQSGQIASQVLALPCFRTARKVSIYLSMPMGEVDTWSLCRAALQQGKRFIHKFTTEMQMLRVYDEHELLHGLTANKWGIAEPPLERDASPREDRTWRWHTLTAALQESSGGSGLDLIILPGVAFDRRGARLGHGRGYYDRYVANARAFAATHGATPPAAIALGLREQVFDDGCVPCGKHDMPVDLLVSPDGVYGSGGQLGGGRDSTLINSR
ncbi:5-formyltetrahydrofolate cyclo-ligase [Malassezia sp. CBS 17886]|nr:5-formyltetrahydrofolate cyclo-ligase [Malassezia sp. CBS 17886]